MILRSLFATNKCRIFALLALALLLSSCHDSFSENQTNEPEQLHDVTVSLAGINISKESYTRASDKSATEAGVKRIALSVFDLNGTLITSVTQDQHADAANFGQPMTFRLPVGSYKFVAVAHGASSASIPVATINSVTEYSRSTERVSNPTYSTVQDVTVSGNTTQSVIINMGTRKNASFGAWFTDANPSDVKKIQLIVAPESAAYTDLKVNPSTGYAASQWKYTKTYDMVAENIPGTRNGIFNVPLMLTATTQTLDVTINALSETDEVLYTRTLPNVTFQQGHRVLAKGTFFSPEATGSFTFDITEINDTISLD